MALMGGEQNKIEVIIGARDETQKELNSIEKKLQNIATKWKALGKEMMLVGGVGTAAIALTVREFHQEEVVVEKLTHVLRTAVGATDEHIEALKQQAVNLQKVGVISDTTVMALQAQLGTFQLSADTIKMMTPAILDMIVAEEGVNATTEDMISYGNAFGMAMEGNYAALTKRGFKLDEDTKRIIENGTETEKAAAIVKYLDSVYAGLNEQMRKTSAGGMAALRNEIGDLAESIGGAVIPIIDSWVKKGQALVEWLNGLDPRLRDFIARAVLIGSVMLVAGGGVIFFVGQLAQMGAYTAHAIGWLLKLGTTGGASIGMMTTAMLQFMLVLVSVIVLIEAAISAWKTFQALRGKKIAEQGVKMSEEAMRAYEAGEITREEALERMKAGQTMTTGGAELTKGQTMFEKVGSEVGRFQQVFADIKVTKEDEIGEQINKALKPVLAGA